MTQPRIMGAQSPPQNRNSQVVGWHFDYLLRCGAVSNGQTIVTELQMDLGAPFCLRGIGGYNVVTATHVVSELSGAFLSFSNSVDQFLQTAQIGTSGDWPSGGLNALYEPVYQQILYPSNSVLQVRLTNSSGADWDSARIVFRGTKLYYRDRIYSPSYPSCYRAIPYQQSLTIPVLASGTFTIPLTVSGADYAFRGGVLKIDSSIAGSIPDLEMKIRDQEGKAYSNDYIHHSWLFSSDLAQRPGLFYPEIYLPKDRQLLIDCQQNTATAPTVNLVLTGERIFPK